LYACKTWSFTLREEQVSENKVLWEVNQKWKWSTQIGNVVIHILLLVRRSWWPRHISLGWGGEGGTNWILVEKSGKQPCERPQLRWDDNIKRKDVLVEWITVKKPRNGSNNRAMLVMFTSCMGPTSDKEERSQCVFCACSHKNNAYNTQEEIFGCQYIFGSICRVIWGALHQESETPSLPDGWPFWTLVPMTLFLSAWWFKTWHCSYLVQCLFSSSASWQSYLVCTSQSPSQFLL